MYYSMLTTESLASIHYHTVNPLYRFHPPHTSPLVPATLFSVSTHTHIFLYVLTEPKISFASGSCLITKLANPLLRGLSNLAINILPRAVKRSLYIRDLKTWIPLAAMSLTRSPWASHLTCPHLNLITFKTDMWPLALTTLPEEVIENIEAKW